MGILDLENLTEAVLDAVGRKTDVHLLKVLQTEIKPNRHEARIVVLCEHCIHIASTKLPMKLEQSINFLEITSVESSSSSEVQFVTDSKKLSLTDAENDANDIDELIYCFAAAYLHIFTTAVRTVVSKMTLSPASRLTELESRLSAIQTHTTGPCGGFTAAYRCACDYHGIQFVDEIAWDVDAIYSSHNSREFTMNEFDHLDTRTLLPVLTALEYNEWFTKLTLANIKLSPEMIHGVTQLLKTNTAISELVLSNVGIKWDTVQRLSASIVVNTHTKLTSLDLSRNSIEDRGLIYLLAVIQCMHSSPTKLNLCHTGITARGVNRLMEVVHLKCETSDMLKTLDLSDNCLKGEDVTNLYNLLRKPNCVTHLFLAATECHLESLFTALSTGCVQSLVHLDISRNYYGTKRSARDSPASWTEFFSLAKALKTVNFSSNRLPHETLKSVLVGLASNKKLEAVELNLSSNALGAAGCQVLESIVADVHCLASLDVSDNGFDHTAAGLVVQLGKNPSVRKLRIGKNVNTFKAKTMPQFIDAVVQLLLDEHSCLEVLSVDDMKLRSELTLLFNALVCNKSLCQLDISGNQAGDLGARALSKVLQVNRKLSVLHWDRNGTSPQGFSDVAAAMQRNHTMTALITPVCDVAMALRVNHEKTERALVQIEAALCRNNLPQKLSVESIYRMQHDLFLSSSHQLLERRARELESVIGKLMKQCLLSEEVQEEIGRGLGLIKDTAAARELLTGLSRVASSVDEDKSLLRSQLRTAVDDLQTAANSQLQTSMSEMLHEAEFKCPIAFSSKIQDEVKNSISTTVDVSKLISYNLNCTVLNAVSVVSFSVASMLCEKITDELLAGLTSCLQSLKQTPVKSELLDTAQHATPASEELPEFAADSIRRAVYMRKMRPRSTAEFTVCESLTPASEMKDSLTLDALPATETDTVLSNVRKSSLPDGTQKTSKPPVPVFRKRTSAGNCVVTDCTAGVQEQSTVGSLSDSVTSAKCDPKSVRSDQKSPVKSNGLRSDTTTVSDDTSGVSQNVSLSCRQQATPTPSLLSAVLATSAASIAMITSQAPSPTHSAAVKQRNDASLTAAFPLPDPDLPRLTHPSKARPRNQKHHAAKCPVVASKFELIENFTGQDVGLDVFFGSVTSDTQQPRSTNQKPVASQRSRSSEAAQVIAETNGKEQDHDHVSDTANLSQDKPSKSAVSPTAMKSRPPPPAPKPRKFASAANTSTESKATDSGKTNTTPITVSKSANNSPARLAQSPSNRGAAVRQYMKRFAEDEDKESTTAAKENVVTSTDGRSSSTESSQKRQMSVREKAAAFLETTMKDSIC